MEENWNILVTLRTKSKEFLQVVVSERKSGENALNILSQFGDL